MSTRKKALLSFPLIVIMVFSLLVPMQIQAYAATDNYTVTEDMSKIKSELYVAKVWENSKYYIYLSENLSNEYSLVRQNKATGKIKTLVKKLPNKMKNDVCDNYIIHAIYGNYVYLTRASSNSSTFWTYKYNLKTKKLTKVASKCGIMEQRGKYLLGKTEYGSSEKACKHSLYKVVEGGKFKKIKSLGHIYNPMKVGKYLYYEYSENNSLHKVKVYRIRFNGKDKKCLGSFKANTAKGSVYCFDFHAKWCRVVKNDKEYKYTYATKKLKKLD